jgi:hypothetical protein
MKDRMLNVRLSEDLYQKLVEAATRDQRTVSSWVRLQLEESLLLEVIPGSRGYAEIPVHH